MNNLPDLKWEPNEFGRAIAAAALGVLLALFVPAAWAQQAEGDVDISRRALLRAKQRVEGNKQLSDEQRQSLVTRYDEALSAAETAEAFAADVARFTRDQDEARRLIRSLQSRQQRRPAATGIDLPESAGAERMQQALRVAQAELEARREAARNIEKIAQQRAQRRAEIARRIGALNHLVVLFDDELATADPLISDPLQRQAARANLLARRRLAQQETAALRAELGSYDVRAELLPLRRDRVQRWVVDTAKAVAELEQRARQRTSAEAEEYRAKLRRECQEAVEKHPALEELAAGVLRYADQLSGPQGVEVQVEALGRELGEMRTQMAQVADLMQLTRRKFDVVGMKGDVTQWFPEVPDSVPTLATLRSEIRRRALQIPDVEHDLISLEEQRAKERDLEGQVTAWVEKVVALPAEPAQAAELESLVRRLLSIRRELLDRLIVQSTLYSSTLQELDSVSRALLSEIERAAEYLFERVIWVRSVHGSVVPSLADTQRAFGWLLANPDWPGSLSRSFFAAGNIGTILAAIIVLSLLIALRPRMHTHLALSAEQALREDNLSFRPTAKAVMITLGLAAPLPVSLALASAFVSFPAPAPVAFAIGQALIAVAVLAFALEMLVQSFGPTGLAEAHLGWPSEADQKVRRDLRRFTIIFLPSALVCLAFSQSLVDFLDSSREIAFINSLGRLAFILATLATAATIHHIVEFKRALEAAAPQEGRGEPQTPYFGLRVVAAVMLLASLLAAAGYYLTAFIFVRRLFLSLLLGLAVLLAVQLLNRWRYLQRKRLTLEEEERARAAAAAPGEAEDIEPQIVHIDVADQHMRQLSRSVTAFVSLVGLFVIWSDVLPSLGVLDRIQIWPKVAFLTDERLSPDGPAGSGDRAAVHSAQAPAAQEPSGGEQAAAPLPLPPGAALVSGAAASGEPAAAAGGESFLSLGELLSAILTLIIMILIAKDLPGLLEFTVLRWFPLNAGDRLAVNTIVRYVLVILGVTAAGFQLGFTWSKIQWLAAAFSFGLAFGLQEIFANFVSGLIILLERPMRVGDFCRFGEQLGTVEGIGLRSTRVRGLDRTIINVPNADFSRKELINFAKRDRMLLKTNLRLRYETTPEQLRYVLAKLRELLLAHPRITDDPARVRFMGFGDYSLNLEVFAYANTTDWNEFLGIQEDVYLRMINIVTEAGTGFAIPSQTTYFARAGGLDSERAEAAESQVDAWRAGGTLPFPEFPQRHRRQIRDTLDFPPAGSPKARPAPAKEPGAEKAIPGEPGERPSS